MKFTVTLKNPDAIDDAINGAVKYISVDNLDEEEIEMLREHRAEEVKQLCRKWFEYGEYLRVEVDTDAKTCTVIPVS